MRATVQQFGLLTRKYARKLKLSCSIAEFAGEITHQPLHFTEAL